MFLLCIKIFESKLSFTIFLAVAISYMILELKLILNMIMSKEQTHSFAVDL